MIGSRIANAPSPVPVPVPAPAAVPATANHPADDSARRSQSRPASPIPSPMLPEESETPRWMLRDNGPRSVSKKIAAGLRGLKCAIRSDASFFAHGYRGLLVILAAALLGVGPFNWCLLAIAACLVLMSELGRCAIQTLANAHPNPLDEGVQAARDMAAAASLVAEVVAIALAVTIFVIKFGDLMGWWGDGPR